MFIKIYPENPNPREIEKVINCLKNGGVIIYPTDTVYSFGADLYNQKAVEKIARLKGIKPEKANFSIICHDLSNLSEYAQQVDNATFKLLKKALPGPFTFILNASKSVPKIFHSKKKTIGLRIPDNPIALEIVRALGNPIIASSVHDEDELIEYTTDPELIYEKYSDEVDLVIDGGYGELEASTIVDCTSGQAEIIRQGIGDIEQFL
jgi:tRNA threonylcarbamoyl adenosine modification protein (Sua5/YciO/YrdC/YwlC family)